MSSTMPGPAPHPAGAGKASKNNETPGDPSMNTPKQVIGAAIGALFCLCTSIATAQQFPARPVKIVVSYPAGGVVDILARPLAQGLQQAWGGNPVVIENRPGANAIIGTTAVAKAPADGYTLLFANDPSLSSNQYLYNSLPYDPVKELTPIITVGTTTLILVAHPSVPAANLGELIALARQKPGEISYGSFGPGSVNHMDMEAFAAQVGVKLLHVPYKGTADLVPAVAAGQVNMGFSAIGPVMPLVRDGKLKAIGVASANRQPLSPQVPTFAEQGVSGFEAISWFGLAAPAGTPQAIIDKLAADIRKVVTQPDYVKRIIDLGLEPLDLGPDQFAQYLVKDRAKYAQRAKTINLKLD
jgi:tripartite-type tricarboxylate transporter receptor subunit TctC